MRILLIALSLSACTPAFVDRETKAAFDPSSTEFWDLPFPSDLRPAERRFTSWPGDWDNDLVAMWLRAGDARVVGGWGLTPGVFVRTTGPIDPATLAGAVVLVDTTTGERLPLELGFLAEADPYQPGHLIAATMLPGAVRKPATTYALLVTDRVRDAAGQPLGATAAFHAWWWDDAQEPLRAFADGVVAAAVFTTVDPSVELRKVAAWTEAQETPALQPWSVVDEGESFVLHESAMQVPVVQNGARPYGRLGEGLLQWDGDDLAVQGTQRVRLSLALPKGEAPAGGWPVTLYLHGSGGEYREGADRGPLPEEAPRREEGDPPPLTGPAEWLARRGIATLSYDFPLHGDRNDPPDTTGQLLYNLLGNIEATLDNYTVSAMELLLLSRAATTIDGLDGTRLTAFGHSMGQTLGVRWATVDPRVQALVLSGAGGGLVETAIEAHSPMDLKPALETLIGMDGAELHVQHPLLHAFQHVWDLVDPVVAARHLVVAPHPGLLAKHVMMGAGHRDGYFGPRAQAKLAGALGVPFVGDVVDPYVPTTLDALGRARVAYPVKRNLHGVTAAVVAYDGPFENGHFVLFDHEAGRYQYTCFLATGALPGPGALDDDCP